MKPPRAATPHENRSGRISVPHASHSTGYRHLRRIMAVAFACACGACTVWSDDGDYATVHSGYGGSIASVHREYKRIEALNKPVRIDGHIASADAFLAFALPDVCYTKNAVWSPHAASAGGLFPLPGITRLLTRQLPDPLAEWFRGNVAYYSWIGWPEIDAEQLYQIWPEGACNDDT